MAHIEYEQAIVLARAVDVDAVAKDILALDDDIADVDPDAEAERINFGVGGLALPQLSLDFNGASDGVDGAREFYQRAVTLSLTTRPE